MARVYSRRAFPHRILFDTGANAQRGADVRLLHVHTGRRLESRDIERSLGPHNGVFNKALREAAKTAARFLGAPDEWTASNAGLLVREQKIIIYPQTRTQEMLRVAAGRMEALLEDRESRPPTPPGGLTDAERARARVLAVAAFRLLYEHRGSVHYTQGASRWQGIRERRRSSQGRFPLYADCSSAVTWCWWNALTTVDGMGTRDRLNGSGWAAGYTGTLLANGWPVSDRKPGDVVVYGSRWPGKHTALVATNPNYVYSHGSESGPHYLRWNYRSDVLSVRRYV